MFFSTTLRYGVDRGLRIVTNMCLLQLFWKVEQRGNCKRRGQVALLQNRAAIQYRTWDVRVMLTSWFEGRDKEVCCRVGLRTMRCLAISTKG